MPCCWSAGLNRGGTGVRDTGFTNLLIDGTIDKSTFGERRDALFLEQVPIKERLVEIERDPIQATCWHP